MNTTSITFNIDQSKKLYKKYFQFERNREFKKVSVKLLFGCYFVLIVVGVVATVDVLWIMGFISCVLTTIFLLYYFLRFQIECNKFSKELEKKALSKDKNFQFSFNSESIFYSSETINSEIKWTGIKDFAINDTDIYLYLENRELLDIISEDILGREMFEKFKSLVSKKLKK